MKRKMVRLGVNIDHAATLRQVRGGTTPYPDLFKIAKEVKRAGAHQITIHLREDRRHIQDHDVIGLCKKRPLKINLEMAATDEMVKIAVKNKPDWVCFVPEKRAELTTEGGLNVVRIEKKLKSYIQKLKKNGIKSSLFIEANLDQVEASARVGAEAVEFHTGHFALASAAGRAKEWPRLKRAALRANLLGLGVHAGHGLDYKSTKQMLRLPHLAELNTGHFLVCESLNVGFYQAVKKMVKIMGAKS